jgi:hypothetical protein
VHRKPGSLEFVGCCSGTPKKIEARTILTDST